MDAEIRCDKMAEAILKNDNHCFEKQSKHFQPTKASCPTKVDDAESNESISDLFADKFF